MLRNRCTLTYTDFHILICIYSYIYSEYFQEDIVLTRFNSNKVSGILSCLFVFSPKKKFTCNFPEISFFKKYILMHSPIGYVYLSLVGGTWLSIFLLLSFVA